MNILFRVDSSDRIGSGHLMRCLTLAYELKKQQANVAFICRELPGNLIGLVKEWGFHVHILKHHKEESGLKLKSRVGHEAWLEADWDYDANKCLAIINTINSKTDWLIVDHYSLDEQWETKLKSNVSRILVIDDLADRLHNCNILLDQNLPGAPDQRYERLVPDYCTVLLGPEYALLRQEFIEARKKVTVRDGGINNILVFFGGTDLSNETEKAIKAIQRLFLMNISTTVIVGKNNPFRSRIEALCKQSSEFSYFCQVDNMAEHMTRSDLAIGAGGSTSWERCAMGLPSILISVADNQDSVSTYIEKSGAAIFLGKKEFVSANYLRETLTKLLGDEKKIHTMSRTAYSLVDTFGTNRVVSKILEEAAIN